MRAKRWFSCFILFMFAACATPQPQIKMQKEAQNTTERVVKCFPSEERPVWVDYPPESDSSYHYFVGISNKVSTETEARDAAMRNAINHFVSFCGVDVELSDIHVSTTEGSTSFVLSSKVSGVAKETIEAEAKVSRIKAKAWHACQLRIYHGETHLGTGWEAKVLVKVPLEEVERVRQYAEDMKNRQKTEAVQQHKEEISQLKDALRPAADKYIEAKGLVGKGEIFQAIKLLEQAEGIVSQHKDKPYFIKAKAALHEEYKEKVIDQAGTMQDRLLGGIALVKVDGDGQSIAPGEKLPRPLVVKAVCRYADKEIPISPAEVEYRLDGETIEKCPTDKDGIGRLMHYTFDEKYYGNVKIIAKLNAKVQKETYFNLSINKPVIAEAKEEEEPLAVRVSFIYEDNGVPRPMWDGMSLRSREDFYYAYFSPEQDCYVYIYQADSSGAVYQMFPNPEYSNAANPVKKGKDYRVPDGDRFYLDDVIGEEKIYFFATKGAATEMDKLFAQLKQTHSQQEKTSIQQQIKGFMYTRGIGGTKPGNSHPVTAKSGDIFQIINQKLESVGPEFMSCLTFRHVAAN